MSAAAAAPANAPQASRTPAKIIRFMLRPPVSEKSSRSVPAETHSLTIWTIWQPLEVIVHAHPEQARRQAIARSGQGKIVAGEIDEQILDLGRPVGREAGLDAGAGGPAHIDMVLRCQADRFGAELAQRKAGRAV